MVKGAIAAISLCLCGTVACWFIADPSTGSGKTEEPASPAMYPHGPGAARTKGPIRAGTAYGTAESLEELAEASLRSPDPQHKETALSTLLPDLIRRDIGRAAELAARLEPWASADEAVALVLDAWLERDPDAAAAWCSRLKGTAAASRWTAYLCQGVAAARPEHAMRLAEEHGLGGDENVTGNIIHSWARLDLSSAIRWAESQADAAFRDNAWNRIARSLAESDAATAATLAVEKIAPGPVQEETVISVLFLWKKRDPEAAAAWVALFPEGPLRERAEGELGSN